MSTLRNASTLYVAPNAPEAGGKAAATRRRILDAAARVLAEKGFSGMRLSDVGEEAGVQAPAIYYHFSNKDELAVEVFSAGLAGCRANLEASLKSHRVDDPLERLAVAIDAHLRICAEQPDYARAWINRVAGGTPEHVREQCQSDERAYVRVWTRLINEAKAAGLLRADVDPRVAQQVILGALNALTIASRLSRSSVESVIASAQRILLSGLSHEERDWAALEWAGATSAY